MMMDKWTDRIFVSPYCRLNYLGDSGCKIGDPLIHDSTLREGEQTPSVVFAAAYKIVNSPQDLDVVVATNLFGDVLSDEAAGVTGGLGIAASANVGEKRLCLKPFMARHQTLREEELQIPQGCSEHPS
ncbi:MAG: isocitrate/isopropylmalate family dehydrogenase [Candidatus Bathyarchaeia archaeon]